MCFCRSEEVSTTDNEECMVLEVYYRKELHLCTDYTVVIHKSLQE